MEKWYIYYKKKQEQLRLTRKWYIYLKKKQEKLLLTSDVEKSDCQRKTLLKVYKTNIVSFKLYFIYN